MITQPQHQAPTITSATDTVPDPDLSTSSREHLPTFCTSSPETDQMSEADQELAEEQLKESDHAVF